MARWIELAGNDRRRRAGRVRLFSFAQVGLALPSVMLIALCCALPLAWLAWTVLVNPEAHTTAGLSWFSLSLLGRTLLYNFAVAILATLLGLPAALVLGRGSMVYRRLLWVVLPVGLMMPSLAYAYGWSQFVRLCRPAFDVMGVTFEPASWPDVARCIWTLAAWLWPIPAVVIGLALRRMDVTVQQQAVLDGVLWRITLRQMLGPIIVSVAAVTLLATQEFAVYEPTGISVVATEVRMVFETGAFSGPTPITNAALGRTFPTQATRAASAASTALPLLAVTILLAGIACAGSTRADCADDIATGSWPRILRAPAWAGIAAVLLAVVTLGVPVGSLIMAMRIPLSASHIWTEFGPELTGALLIAAVTVALCLLLSLVAVAVWVRGSLLLAGLSFLIGGELLAIAMIRIWSRSEFTWIYDAWPLPVMAYLGRFGWLSLAMARGSWTSRWDELRAMASLDGAGPVRTALWVLWPLVWPSLLAAALLAGALSMTEVAATVLLHPQNPQVLTPMLMSWVHMARYDPMIEASLLMMAMVFVPTLLAVGLWSLSQHLSGRRSISP